MGWMKIDFPTFRDVYEPLRRRRVWSESDQKVLRNAVDLGAAYALRRLYSRSATTKKQIETLKIEKSRLEESNSRKERELRHEIGLEKKRQEFVEAAR